MKGHLNYAVLCYTLIEKELINHEANFILITDLLYTFPNRIFVYLLVDITTTMILMDLRTWPRCFIMISRNEFLYFCISLE